MKSFYRSSTLLEKCDVFHELFPSSACKSLGFHVLGSDLIRFDRKSRLFMKEREFCFY